MNICRLLFNNAADAILLSSRKQLTAGLAQLHSSSAGMMKSSGSKENSAPVALGIITSSAPKMPEKPFDRYIRENNTMFPNMTLEERMDKLKFSWAGLSEFEKHRYNIDYLKEKEEYYTSYRDFLKKLDSEDLSRVAQSISVQHKQLEKQLQKRKVRQEKTAMGKPKRAMSAYARFTRDVMEQGAKSVSEAAQMWKNLPDHEREVYLQEFKKDREQYNILSQIWEDKMKEIGREDLLPQRTKLRKAKSAS